MERLIIYLHRNVNNSKFIKKKFPPEIRPAPPLNYIKIEWRQQRWINLTVPVVNFLIPCRLLTSVQSVKTWRTSAFSWGLVTCQGNSIPQASGLISTPDIYTTKIDGVVSPPNISETAAGRLMKLAHRQRIASTTITLISKQFYCPFYQF